MTKFILLMMTGLMLAACSRQQLQDAIADNLVQNSKAKPVKIQYIRGGGYPGPAHSYYGSLVVLDLDNVHQQVSVTGRRYAGTPGDQDDVCTAVLFSGFYLDILSGLAESAIVVQDAAIADAGDTRLKIDYDDGSKLDILVWESDSGFQQKVLKLSDRTNLLLNNLAGNHCVPY